MKARNKKLGILNNFYYIYIIKKLSKVLLLSLLFVGCEFNIHESSEKMATPIKYEKGVVVAKQFQSEFNDWDVAPGISMGGELVISSHSTHIPEQWNVVFRCSHGVLFTINKPELYEKLDERDSVIIEYREIIRRGEVVDLDFIDANKADSVVWNKYFLN